jgi:hypothetical protein
MMPIPADAAFFHSLYKSDHDLFLELKAKGCPACGAPLDTSNFTRKPRGSGEDESLRLSLCCRREGCRKRLTPPSLRFFGRRVYTRWVVILALDFGPALELTIKISRQTLSRWRCFWREQLGETSSLMRWARGFLPPGHSVTERPESIVGAFGFPAVDSWIPMLRFFMTAASPAF